MSKSNSTSPSPSRSFEIDRGSPGSPTATANETNANDDCNCNNFNSEITEITKDVDIITTNTSLISVDVNNARSDVVYVAVGESQTSMDALSWTLNNHDQNYIVNLVHIFPPLKFIPGPTSRSFEIERGSPGSPTAAAKETNANDDCNCFNFNSEITEITKDGDIITNTSLISIDVNNARSDVVYVAVGESQTSMDALSWTLNNHDQNYIVNLVHIFPPLKFIPGPMGAGKVCLNQVSPESAESYLAEHRSQIRQLVGKYMDKCASYKVQADTILIESDSVADAILELIYVLDIAKLVLGISKSNARKLRGEKGNGKVAYQILENAPVGCEIKIICQDKEVKSEQCSKSSAITPTTTTSDSGCAQGNELNPRDSNNNSFSCCFKPSF